MRGKEQTHSCADIIGYSSLDNLIYTFHSHGTSTLPPTSRILNAQLGYPNLRSRIFHKRLSESMRKSCNLQLLFAWRILWRESAATVQYCKGQCTNDVCLISRIFDPLSPLVQVSLIFHHLLPLLDVIFSWLTPPLTVGNMIWSGYWLHDTMHSFSK